MSLEFFNQSLQELQSKNVSELYSGLCRTSRLNWVKEAHNLFLNGAFSYKIDDTIIKEDHIRFYFYCNDLKVETSIKSDPEHGVIVDHLWIDLHSSSLKAPREDREAAKLCAYFVFWGLAQIKPQQIKGITPRSLQNLKFFGRNLVSTLKTQKIDKVKTSELNSVCLQIPVAASLFQQFLDQNLIVEGSSFSFDRKKNQYRSYPTNKNVSLIDLPQQLQRKPFSQEDSSDHAKELSLAYFFADGTIIDGSQIHFHKYATQIEPEHLPLRKKKNPLFESLQLPTTTSLSQESALSLLFALSNLAQSDFSVSLQFFTSDHLYSRPIPIQTFAKDTLKELTHLQAVAETNPKNAEPLTWSFRLFGERSSVFLSSYFLFDFNQSQFYFHTLNENLKPLLSLFTEKTLAFKPYQYGIDSFFKKFTVEETNQNIKIFQNLNNIGVPLVSSLKSETIEDADCSFYFGANEVRICHSFLHQKKSYSLWGIPPQVEFLFEHISQSFFNSSFFAAFLKNYQKKKYSRKINDIKFLKHRGISNLIFHEFVNLALEDDGEFNQDHFENSFTAAQKVFSQTLNTSISSQLVLEQMISPHLISELKSFYQHLLKIYKSSLVSYNTHFIFNLKNSVKPYFTLIKSLLDSASLISNGDFYIRPNKTFITDSTQSSTRTLPPIVLKKQDENNNLNWKATAPYEYFSNIKGRTLEPWSFLFNEEIDIFYNGLKIEQLDSSKIEAKVNLTESTEDPESQQKTDNQKIDWFEMNPVFFLDGEEISYQKAMAFTSSQMIEHKGKFFVLKDNEAPKLKALQWFWSHLGALPENKKKKGSSEKGVQLPRNKTLELLALRKAGIEINGGPFWQKVCEFYDSLDKKESYINVPEELQAELKKYQIYGYDWLYTLFKLRLGAILADDMGLGKTIQTLSFLQRLHEDKLVQNSLIVVPTSLTYNWISEAKKFTPSLKIHRFESKKKDEFLQMMKSKEPKAVIVSYGLFSEQVEFFSQFTWDVHIYDEAQNLKNLTSKRTKSARSLPAQFKLCLTGTPLENHYDELFSLVDLAVPGSLGSIKNFRRKYVNNNELTTSDIHFLKMKIKPLILRRTKKQILKELPDKSEVILKIPFDEKQKKIYRDIALSWNSKVKQSILEQGEKKSQVMMLTALLRLRQACSDPSGIPNTQYKDTPPKLKALQGSLEQITANGHSALVFTQFISTLQHIEKVLDKSQVPHYSLHGSLTQKQRETVLKSFQENEKGSVLVMTLKTGGVGLNLTKANYVFHLEPWWNPAVENQANDRTHRIGQNKNVTVYRYLMKESVEEKVELLKEKKAARFASLFSDEEELPNTIVKSPSRGLTRDDFEFLLSTDS